jgi:hypothetical protein
MMAKVYIASMKMRGQWAEKPAGIPLQVINVTSAQGSGNTNRRDFSPMTAYPGGYKGFYNFEAYWQSGKVYESIPLQTTLRWWQSIHEAKRRYPGSKGKKVLYSMWPQFGKTQLGYIESRIRVYVPEYYAMIKEHEMLKHWCQQVRRGKNVVVYDFDGPWSPEGVPLCLEISLDLLQSKLHDISKPFGHGYIVAGLLAGITPEMYLE